MSFPNNFFEWLTFWWEYYHKPAVKGSTCTCTFYKIKTIKRLSENCLLNEVDEFFCQHILNQMFDLGYSKSSIEKIRIVLRQAFSVALKKRIIQCNPALELQIPKAHTKKVEALSISQQQLVESICGKMQYGYVFVFLLYTGLRKSEMKNLKWSDFDETHKEIFIRESKTTAGVRTIPLVTKAYDIIQMQQHSTTDNYIFHSPMGHQLSDTFLKRLYNEVRELSGISTFTNHVCRHSFATRLIERGAQVKSVSALLGHAKTEYALNIYINLEKSYMQKEIFLLESKLQVG